MIPYPHVITHPHAQNFSIELVARLTEPRDIGGEEETPMAAALALPAAAAAPAAVRAFKALNEAMVEGEGVGMEEVVGMVARP